MPTKPLAADSFRFDVTEAGLVLTVDPTDVHLCPDCPYLHVVLLTTASKANVLDLAHGLAHLASHLPDPTIPPTS